MARNIPILIYADVALGGSASVIILDSSVDTQYTVALNGTNNQGEPAYPTHAIVDNTGNNGVVYVDYGFSRYSVAPYTRKTFPIFENQLYIRFQLAVNTVPITFTTFDPGYPDEVNQVATGAVATGGGGSSGGDSSATNTWDNTKHDAGLYLLQANMYAARDPYDFVGSYSPVISINGHTTGKYYFELKFVAGADIAIAIGNDVAVNKNSGAAPFNNLDGFSWSSAYGIRGLNGGLTNLPGSMPTFAGDDTVCCAIDFGANLVWFKKAGGLWNNRSACDPANATNGIGFAAMNAGTRYAGVALYNGDAIVNFGASLFVNTAPTGFGNF